MAWLEGRVPFTLAGGDASVVVSELPSRAPDLAPRAREEGVFLPRGVVCVHEGRNWTTGQIAEHSGCSRSTIELRLHRGVTGEALFAPPMPHREFTVLDANGKAWTAGDIARATGLNVKMVRLRIKRGLPFEQACRRSRKARGAYEDLAREHGLSRMVVKGRLYRGIPLTQPFADRGAPVPLEVREQVRAAVGSHVSLAKRFGLCRATIARIRRGYR